MVRVLVDLFNWSDNLAMEAVAGWRPGSMIICLTSTFEVIETKMITTSSWLSTRGCRDPRISVRVAEAAD